MGKGVVRIYGGRILDICVGMGNGGWHSFRTNFGDLAISFSYAPINDWGIKRGNNKIKYCIAGPICENSDIFANSVILPKQSIGDILMIEDVGAYGSVMSSNYNSKVLPAEILIRNNKHYLIRKSQKINDLIKRDNIPDWIL